MIISIMPLIDHHQSKNQYHHMTSTIPNGSILHQSPETIKTLSSWPCKTCCTSQQVTDRLPGGVTRLATRSMSSLRF